jgi:teichuronic acid exporter
VSLKKKSAAGVFWYMSSNGFSQGVNFVVYLLLARLISVEDFGLVAFSFLLIEFVSVFMSVGINQNLIRKEHWQNDFSSSSHWLIIILSAGVSLSLLFIVTPLMQYFYSPKGAIIVAALAIIPIVNGFRMSHVAKMQREFANKKIAMIDSFSMFIGGVVSISLALLDFGAWSIVIGRILQSFTCTLATWKYSDFKPLRLIDASHVKESLSFGLPMLYMAILGFFSSKTTSLLVGLFLGPAVFAFISVAQKSFLILLNLTVQPLNKVMIATISRVENSEIPHAYYRIVRLSAFFIFPVYLGLGAVADPFIRFAFGDKWQDSIILMSIFSLAIPAVILGWYLPTILISLGQTKAALRIKLLVFVVNVVLPALTLHYGVQAMVISTVAAAFITLPVRFKIVAKYSDVSLLEALKHIYPFIICGIFMFVGVLFVSQLAFINEISLILKLIIMITCGVFLYLLPLILLFSKPLKAVFVELKGLKN